jgi:hypothetical protein
LLAGDTMATAFGTFNNVAEFAASTSQFNTFSNE